MGADAKIEWTDHTFNPWWGCTKVSPGCTNCYAEALDRRTGGSHWGPKADRRRTGPDNWKLPLRWNRKAAAEGKRYRVFCASMADVFDDHPSILPEWREYLWALIEATPHLDWLLLTKRPANIMKMIPERWRDRLPDHVAVGATVINQAEADANILKLLMVPARVRFLSMEPLLGPVDLTRIVLGTGDADLPASPEIQKIAFTMNALTGAPKTGIPGLDWIIVGGESGPGARPMHPDWVRQIRDQCAAAGVPFFFKQWGEWAPPSVYGADTPSTLRLRGGAEGRYHVFEDHQQMSRIGKRDAGRMLDGVAHDAHPFDEGAAA
jgi:protein gp37